ncbi:PilZ domain-containing protein [Novosphingobium sp. Gsoil 351]|uniref:PilZ domain-containing protein n=1 Tax=Novosphingobium sp. Gsoil 351 TaxID=2675225 RepID=UPI0012B4BD2E|nr:PilZ domain-containing protein [Novosphingobium sp. Gsoil 351]QGN54653.1 PilZ domain-containing protein [Novosphingobium sp. Gsoil 351]
MADDDHRHLSRDSLFLMAELRLPGEETLGRVKVRNLSAGGMMAEGAVKAVRGTLIEVNIRNVGWVGGAIAWVQGDRCGIAFNDDIDPLVARAPVTATRESTLRFAKPAGPFVEPERTLRKI